MKLDVITLDAGLEGAIVQGMHDPVTGQPVIEPDLARMIGERIAMLSAERGLGLKAFACETRPLLQGARITAWELAKAGVDATPATPDTPAAEQA